MWVFLLTVSQTAAAKATDSASFIVNPSRQFHHRDRRKIIDIMAAHEPIEVEDDEESIDEEQLEDYEDMVEQLGSFPDKVKINSLSMVAEDHADSKKSAMAIYNTIRKQLLGTSQDKMLPLVYVLDSILKNAKGEYIPIVEDDAANWIPEVHRRLHDSERIKLQKVWRTWSEFKIFSTDHLRAMGLCFDERVSDKAIGSSAAKVAGISRTVCRNKFVYRILPACTLLFLSRLVQYPMLSGFRKTGVYFCLLPSGGKCRMFWTTCRTIFKTNSTKCH
jgi:hypothetical protein